MAHPAFKLTTMREVLSAIGVSRDIVQGQFVNNVVAATDAFFLIDLACPLWENSCQND